MRALDRKLLRDAWHYRAQLAAIAAVATCGIALFVTLRSMNGYLRGSRDAFYDAYRFADVFASVKRAPLAVARDVAAIPGVRVAEPRVVGDVTLDVRGLPEPAVGRLVSIPVPREPSLNALHLLSGRWPDARRGNEVLASAAFSRANGLAAGDSLGAIVNGRWEWLRIVGTAISPEYVYELGGFSLFPDNRRFGVLWMGREALARAFDLQGAFNDLTVALAPGASEPEVIARMDRLLERYGTPGAHGRKDQLSHQFLTGEIEETQVTSVMLPAIFIGVPAFLLHIVLSRLVTMQREQVAVLKAFGFSNAAVGTHFVLLALFPVAAGALLGSLGGLWLAGKLAVVYGRFFQFPTPTFVPDWGVVAAAVAIGAAAGLAGALGGVRRSVVLPPAEAMRPEPPARFHHGAIERLRVVQALSAAWRIVMRNLARRPVRSLLSVLAIALAGGIVITTQSMFDAIQFMKTLQFHEITREDVTVIFEGARDRSAVGALARLAGVLDAEPFRAVSVRLRTAQRDVRTAMLGLPAGGRLHRIVDEDLRVHRPPEHGVLASAVLANRLGVQAGGRIVAEVLEGRRQRLVIEVAGVTNELIGTTAYMELGALGRLVGDEQAVSGAYLAIDPRIAADVYAQLKRLPAVREVGVRRAALEGFERTIAENFSISLTTALVFACVIAFGIVYNGARVALSERARELASLRVLGFTQREVTTMLLGEQGILTILALPVGFLVAFLFTWLLSTRFDSELFRIPVVVSPRSYLLGSAIVLVSALLSALAVRGRVRRLDLVSVLKTRE